MNTRLTGLYKPTYAEMKIPLSSFEAAMLVAGIPKGTPHREARKDGRVERYKKAIQKAARIYENGDLPDAYRLEFGIPTAWDGCSRVYEKKQVERWKARRFTENKRARYTREATS